MVVIINEHLDDIDYRSRAQRRKQAIPDFIKWRESIKSVLEGRTNLQAHEYDKRFLEGQLAILGSVLWTLMDEKEYKQLMKFKGY